MIVGGASGGAAYLRRITLASRGYDFNADNVH
jgi:hypothetical protein